jgi:hypothetical protein
MKSGKKSERIEQLKKQYNIAKYNQVFSKTLNFPFFLHIKKFIFEKLDCHLQ